MAQDKIKSSDVNSKTGTGDTFVFSTSPSLVTPALGTPASGNLANTSGLPVSGITPSTSTALGVGSVELGHASDTTLSRGASGFLAVEGKRVPSPASQASGDMLYRGGTEWERLPKGTASQVLTMNAGATAPEWQTPSGGGAWTLVHYASGTGVSELTKSSLDLSADLHYQIIVHFESASTNARNIRMQINGDTGNNYNFGGWRTIADGSTQSTNQQGTKDTSYWAIDGNNSNNTFQVEINLSRLLSDATNYRINARWLSNAEYSATNVDQTQQFMGGGHNKSQTNVTSIRVFQTAGTGNWRIWILKPNTA